MKTKKAPVSTKLAMTARGMVFSGVLRLFAERRGALEADQAEDRHHDAQADVFQAVARGGMPLRGIDDAGFGQRQKGQHHDDGNRDTLEYQHQDRREGDVLVCQEPSRRGRKSEERDRGMRQIAADVQS